jgi:predicted O-methyltransferase YrrM
MEALTSYLDARGHTGYEGNVSSLPEQAADLARLAADPSVKTIMEIGFNAGHSALSLLSASKDTVLTSFDLNVYSSVQCAKEYIDAAFPNRHTLLLGDSKETVPAFSAANPTKTFDLIFIDGGHTFDTALADLLNCKHLAHADTLVVMDDVIFELEVDYSVGPTRAWKECVARGIIDEIQYTRFAPCRGQVIGRYIFSDYILSGRYEKPGGAHTPQ